MDQNRSKVENMTTTQETNTLTSSQKIAFRLGPPDLRRSKAIAVILIECGVEWCMIQGKQLVRTGRKQKYDGDTANKKYIYLVTKSRLATRAAGPTPLQGHCYNFHRTLHRLMYDTGATIGQNRSKEQNVTAPQPTNTLTSSQKIAFRLEPPDLRQSKAIAVIRIECGVEWCMIQAKQLVRTGRKNKM